MYQLFRDKTQIACMDTAGSWATDVEEVKTFCKYMSAMLDFDNGSKYIFPNDVIKAKH